MKQFRSQSCHICKTWEFLQLENNITDTHNHKPFRIVYIYIHTHTHTRMVGLVAPSVIRLWDQLSCQLSSGSSISLCTKSLLQLRSGHYIATFLFTDREISKEQRWLIWILCFEATNKQRWRRITKIIQPFFPGPEPILDDVTTTHSGYASFDESRVVRVLY
jgi:hypothetical protein